jgi:mono/diheme cytochrome c family protein
MSNVDTETGLDMKVRGEPGPKFYQMINTLERHPALPMSQRGYIYVAPNIDKGDVVASASAFRNAFNSATDNEHKKEIFVKYMGTFNQGIFDLLKSKAEKKMSEDINILKFLAGMLNEAPMDYSDDDDVSKEIDNTDDDGYKPGFSQKNMMTQLGKVADSEDASKDAELMKVKKFDKITSVTTDDGDSHQVSGAEADALIKMFNMLSSQRAGEEESPREKFNRAIQKTAGLTQMLDFAKSKGLVKEETAELPTLDLADIRSDYEPELEEGGECYHCDGDDEDCATCHGTGYAGAGDDDSQEPSQEEMDKHAKKESAPFGEPSQDEEMYDRFMDAYQKGGEPALAKAMGLSDQELDQEMTEWAMDHNLHMDDDRDDVIHGYIEDTVHNRDVKDYGSAMAESKNCGCNQDPCVTYGKKESNEDLETLKKLAGLN